MKIIVKNISELVQVEKNILKWKAGKEMSRLTTIKDAFLEIQDGLISNFGNMEEWKGIDDWNKTEIIDADGGMVFPSYCDSHSHLVFAESRENEFVDRINGLSYQQIAKSGGGILNSVKKLREFSENKLFEDAKVRLKKIINQGTGAIEIKSGYGLTLESELKMLRIIKSLKESTNIEIRSTLLAAHAVPPEFKKNKKGYLDLIITEILPNAVKEDLVDFVDIFCEHGYFNVNDTIRIIEAGSKFNIKAKVHVNQFTSFGGVKASVESGALSVDHLEEMNEEDYLSLIGSDCIPTILPACSFFLGLPYGPAKNIINKGLPLALASDFNPGSSPTGNMNFISSLGCIKLKMTPEQVINATTINGAYAMGIQNEFGTITLGKKASIFITEPIPSYSYLPYNFGESSIKKVILNGIVQ